MRRFLLPWLLCVCAVPALAQPPEEPSQMVLSVNPTVREGELRLDGQISAVLDDGVWELDAFSWTSTAGKVTPFAEQKTKMLHVGAGFFAHFDGLRTGIATDHITVGTHVAVIGRNKSDNSLDVREIVVYRPNDEVHFYPGHPVNVDTARYCSLAHKAQEAGDFAACIEWATKGLEAARGANDGWGTRMALGWRGFAYLQIHQYKPALADYQQMEASSRAAGYVQGEAQSLMQEANVFIGMRRDEDAFSCSQRALALHPANLLLERDIRNQIGVESMLLHRNDEAIAMIETVLPLDRQFKAYSSIAREDFDLATLHTFKRDAQLNATIEAEIAEGRNQLPLVFSPGRRAELEQKLARLLWYRGDHDGAKQEIEDACADFAAAKRPSDADLARLNLGKWQTGTSPFDATAN